MPGEGEWLSRGEWCTGLRPNCPQEEQPRENLRRDLAGRQQEKSETRRNWIPSGEKKNKNIMVDGVTEKATQGRSEQPEASF